MERVRIDISQDLDGDAVVHACFDLSPEELAAAAHAVAATAWAAAASSSGLRSKQACTTGSPSRSCEMSMRTRSMYLRSPYRRFVEVV